MTPLQRLRLEKVAADCGFEMTPQWQDEDLLIRSSCFPETLRLHVMQEADGTPQYLIFSTDMSLLQALPFALADAGKGMGAIQANGLDALYEVLKSAAAHARNLPHHRQFV